MAYRLRTDGTTRAATMMAVVGLHAIIFIALSLVAVGVRPFLPPPAVDTFDVTPPEPPPPIEIETPKDVPINEGLAAKVQKRSPLSPITVPDRLIETPLISPAPVSLDPNVGREILFAGFDRGGSGAGAAGLGDGAEIDRSRGAILIEETKLKLKDYSRLSRKIWRRSDSVQVSFNVQLNGRASDCRVVETSGSGTIDYETCRIVERKLRLRPALDDDGRPHVGNYSGYVHYEDML